MTGTSYIDTTASLGTTYYYVVDSVNSIGVSGNSPEASAMLVAPETAGLASPWTDVDVGVSTGGTATLSGGAFTVKSGPGVIGGTNDGFHFVYQPMAGDGSITAQVQSQTGANSGAVAGLSIRDNLAINATMAIEGLQANNKADFYLCGGDGGSASGSSYSSSIAAPYWVRLVRAGLNVTGFISPDGVTWTQTGNYTFSSLPYVTYVGLYVETGNASSGQTNTAVFTNVTLPLGATAVASAPTGLTTLSATSASASLSWTAPVGAFSYNVKRGTSASGPFTTVATGVLTNTYTDYGLVNGATYYYVVSAVNSAGESANSSAVTAALLPPPTTLSGLTVAASGTQSVLTWASSAGATSYVVSRATTYAGPYTVIASGVTGDSYTDTGVSSTTLYYYEVTPTNSAGSGPGSTISSVSAGLPAPWLTQDIGDNVPGGAYASSGVFNLFGSGYIYGYRGEPCRYVYQTVTGDCAMTIRITGQSNANYDITGIMIRDTMDTGSRYIYLDLVSNASGSSVNFEYRSALGGAISSNYSGITSGTPCWLRVVRLGAYTALYTSPDGKAWTQFSVPNFTMNPTVCIGMAASSGDPGAINTATIDNVAVTAGVNVGGTATASADNAQNGQGAAQAFDDNIGTKWYDYTSDTGWLQYQFATGTSQAVNQYQLISAEDVPQRDPAAWQFQGSNNGSTWTTLDTQTGQLFANRNQANVYNITNTTAYAYYRLNITANAAGGGGNGIQLSELGLYTTNVGTTRVPPAAPLDLSSDWNNSQIALSWDATYASTSYNVKRATVSGGPYTTIASGVATPSYNDTSVVDGTTYYYVVSAVNAGGESANSIENSATAYAIPATPTGVTATAGSTQVTLNWTAVAGASQYWIGRATTSGGPYTDLGFVSGTSFADSALTNYTTYYYVVAASNLGELSGNSNQISAIPLPSDAPWNFSSTAGNTMVALTWNAPPGATGYAVKRSTTNGGPYSTVIANTPGISYVDTGLTNGTAYYYIITPLFGVSTGDNSVQISATPSSSTTLLVRSRSGSGTGTTAAGDSPQESPTQAFDGNVNTKWFTQTSPAVSQPDWLQYQFGNNLAWTITQYTITSANDVPQRDPASWQLLASNDGATWVTLDTRSGQTFSGRYTTNSYTLTNTTPYRYYRLSVTADSGGTGSGYGLQLSEFALLSSPSDAGDKTNPVLTLPSNISTPATSGSGAYVSFSVTANDAVSGALIPSVTPPSGSQFPIGTTTVQCSAIDLAGNTTTGSFTVTVTGTPAVASASAGASGEQAAQAFDTSLGTKWYNGVTGGTGWLQYQFANSAAKVVQGYAITSASDVAQRDPAAWQFEGSQNGSTWTVLDTQSAQSFSARYLTKLYPITNTTAYVYYRLNVTANSGGSGYGVQLSELTFIYSLSSPWSTADIGTTGITGAVGSDSGIYTMVGAGTDITGTSDSFRYAYQAATGDCSITARVAAFANFNAGPRVGVMIRESLNANSTHATLALTPSSGLVVRYRSTTGAGTTSSGGSGSAPYWVRVTRSGNTFTFYSSSDGATWTTLTTTTISMATNVYIGLVETSGTAGTLTISNIDNVTAAP